MATTQLSPSALPGRRYTFAPKFAGKGVGPFTALAITGIPGVRLAFLPKSSAEPPGVAGDDYWHSTTYWNKEYYWYVAYWPAGEIDEEDVVVVHPPPGGGFYSPEPYKFKVPERLKDELRAIHKDDEEVLQIIIQAVISGLLDG